MKTAKQVEEYIVQLKNSGIPLSEAAWKTALACVGWPYIFGDRGVNCTPSHRRAAYASKGGEHPTIKSKCKNFNGTGACSGCQFYPGGVTKAFDCRGFTYWVLLQAFGWKLMGAGATSQWNTASNWKSKGEIGSMPRDTLCCLFVRKGNTMQHTGFGLNDETVECSSGVQHFTKRNKKWTHWAVPVCIDGQVTPQPTPEPTPDPSETHPTLKKGSKGTAVKELQQKLMKKGYSLPKYGADGQFGNETLKAVMEFQKDCGLTADGIVGKATWDKLDDDSQVKPQPTPEPVPVPVPTPSKSHPTLKKGSKGADVTELQQKLMAKGYPLPKYGADGQFGNETLTAVRNFQHDQGLTVDGIVGKNTWARLDA